MIWQLWVRVHVLSHGLFSLTIYSSPLLSILRPPHPPHLASNLEVLPKMHRLPDGRLCILYRFASHHSDFLDISHSTATLPATYRGPPPAEFSCIN